MEQQNTTLDDISSVIGFSPTLRLSAWYGNGNNLYIPDRVEDGQVLVLLLGRSRFGWRGRKAVRVLYAGAGLLLLGYVGSRFVLEVVLGRSA